MNVNIVARRARRRPFKPFELRLQCGQRHPVRHPEQILVGKDLVVVVNRRGEVEFIAPEAIVSISPARNGHRRVQPDSRT